MINQFSTKFDFDSIGFKFNLSKEFDDYLKNYYINNEFKNSNKYFEIIGNNSDIYIHKILNESLNIKMIL